MTIATKTITLPSKTRISSYKRLQVMLHNPNLITLLTTNTLKQQQRKHEVTHTHTQTKKKPFFDVNGCISNKSSRYKNSMRDKTDCGEYKRKKKALTRRVPSARRRRYGCTKARRL